ncbi:MAG: hypothetical protein ABSA74_00255 [Candidatus Staskawiczbacteria bacterium]|jgi:flagellar basal body-associated protein FliL
MGQNNLYKENWFKIIIAIAILIVAISAGYYFIALSKQQRQINDGYEAKARLNCFNNYEKLFKNKGEINDPLNYDKTNPALYDCLNKLKNPLGI